MRSLLVLCLSVLATACTTRGEEYICWNKDTRSQLDAVAKIDRISGKIEGYTAVDHNNLTIEIGPSNSAQYVCQSRLDAEAQQREMDAMAAAAEDAALEAEEERARAAEAIAENFLEASKERQSATGETVIDEQAPDF